MSAVRDYLPLDSGAGGEYESAVMVDEAVKTELLKMSIGELCQLVSVDLGCLQGLKDSGVDPKSGMWKHYAEEIQAARSILN